MKVRHLPTVVDAVPWDGSRDALAELVALGLTDYSYTDEPVEPSLVIHTPEGNRSVLIGDVVVRGTQGEFYPIKPDVYAACYEPHTGELA